jgi:hypothetical protein
MFTASVAYQVPRQMVEQRSSPVDLWIDPELTPEELRAALLAFLRENAERAQARLGESVKLAPLPQGSTDLVARSTLAANRMVAELLGEDFDISPKGPQELRLVRGQTFKWSWNARPKGPSGPGGFQLEIRVFADPGEGRAPVQTIREVVMVIAREKSWFEWANELDAWIKLLGGGGLGAALIWLFRGLSRREEQQRTA